MQLKMNARLWRASGCGETNLMLSVTLPSTRLDSLSRVSFNDTASITLKSLRQSYVNHITSGPVSGRVQQLENPSNGCQDRLSQRQPRRRRRNLHSPAAQLCRARHRRPSVQLQKAIYGLKQAPRCWYLTLHKFLVGIGFERCIKEVCLYIKRVGESMVLLIVYVDDITITGNNNDGIEKACDELKQRFEMTDLGQLKSILGVQVDVNGNVVTMSQQGYVEVLLDKFNMVDCNPVSTPEVIGQVLKPSKRRTEATL
ncbi:Aste57867_17344 [Aphanomyces stellatus]|uniref:Aste57867_17344 protein n=1 Tax=Aphanomyces stellatus TaxID=120398 RepID=A0A485L7P5_9STRA|nr:hypothetical protein As57867_017285 [Aphanomyces stellatus]VFT94100.1 Aste57867_17344 [Aphanomyces stellatus]